MKVGMFWFDDSRKKLATKIRAAKKYYVVKYHRQPTLCYIHPENAGKHFIDPENNEVKLSEIMIEGLKIRQDGKVLPHHLWIGLERSAT